MNQTLSCLVIPNLTAYSINNPHGAKGLGTALCVEPTPHLPAFKDQSMMLFVSFVLCIPQMTKGPASVIFYLCHHFISEANLLTS